jgi:Glyoxalase-like domain
MISAIDHLVVAVAEPDQAAAELEATIGLRSSGAGRHEALGTYNRLVWFGDTYLELVGVFDPDVAAASWLGGPTLATLAHGAGLVTWAVATDDLELELRRAGAASAAITGPIPGERIRPDGRTVRWRLGLPARIGPDEPPFLIEHDPTGAEWRPADRAARAIEAHPVGGPVRLVGLDLRVRDPQTAAVAFGARLGSTFRTVGDDVVEATLGPQRIRLRPDRRPAPNGDRRTCTIELAVTGIPPRVSLEGAPSSVAIDLLGCRFIVG